MSTTIEKSGIGWTWPPWVDKGKTLNHQLGCQHAGGPGCDNCWAEQDTYVRQLNPNEKMAKANAGLTVLRENKRPRWTGKYNLLPERMASVLRTKQRWGIFSPSKSDPWYEPMMSTDEGRRHVAAAYGLAAVTRQHTWFWLTKRTEGAVEHQAWLQTEAERAGLSVVQFCVDMLQRQLAGAGEPKLAAEIYDRLASGQVEDVWPLPNVWILTSVENQECYDKRVGKLLEIEAAVLGLSAEPLLGPITIAPEHAAKLGWVIVGGESGDRARPLHPTWVESLRDQCESARIPLFWKQWGKYGPSAVNMLDGSPVVRCFSDKLEWVNKATSWMSERDICVDLTGKVLKRGGDFDTASYPVAVLRDFGRGMAPNLLGGQRLEQFPPEPAR